MKKTGAEIIWECLVREGVTHVFGYPGGTILPTYDAIWKYPVHHVLVRHEQGASHMADGYARASGRWEWRWRPRSGATNLVNRHRYGHAGFIADRVHHRSGGEQGDRAGLRSRKLTSPASPFLSPSTMRSSPAPRT